MGWQLSGNFTTAAANATLYWWTVFNGSAFVGPLTVAPNFAGGDENFGQLTVGDMTVEATEGNAAEPNAYYPVSFTYEYPITNDSPWPLSYNVALGTF